MAYRDLREFIRALEQKNELKRIPFEVDPILEITEFADRAVKQGGPALLFEKPKGYGVPVLINAFASMRKMEIALEVESVEEVARAHRRVPGDAHARGPHGQAQDAAETGGDGRVLSEDREQGRRARRWCGTTGSRCSIIPCCNAGRRTAAASSRCRWSSRAIPIPASATAACTACRCSTSAPPACTGRRTSRAPSTTAACGHHGRTRMDVAVAIGADPATMYSAILPLPPDLDEMMIAGFLRQSPVEMVKCQTSDLEVPANAEIVLEGYVELGELRTEGPFGDHTGFYSLADEYPVFHVTCVTQRKDPIYATTIVGPPPMEDYYMGKAIERIFLPLMRLQLPEVRDIAMPPEGVFHNLILVAIRKSYPGHARKVMHSIWGTGQAMFSKCIVVVDEDVDVQNYSEVAWKALNNIDPAARYRVRDGAGGFARPCQPAARITGRRWGSTRRGSGPAKASRGPGPA